MCLSVSVSHMCPGVHKTEEGTGFPGAGIRRYLHVAQCRCQELNPGHLQEQQALLTTECCLLLSRCFDFSDNKIVSTFPI